MSIKTQISRSGIPYPQRHWLAVEVERDLEAVGVATDDAKFLHEELEELSELHATHLYRWLAGFGAYRRMVETWLSVFPLMMGGLFIFKEMKMIEFMIQGGVSGMLIILALGLFLLGKEILQMLRLVFIKDHSAQNLQLDSTSVFLGCAGVMFIAIGWTAMGLYKTTQAVMLQQNSMAILLEGAHESLTPVVLASALSALVVFAHYTTRNIMRIWHAPVSALN